MDKKTSIVFLTAMKVHSKDYYVILTLMRLGTTFWLNTVFESFFSLSPARKQVNVQSQQLQSSKYSALFFSLLRAL